MKLICNTNFHDTFSHVVRRKGDIIEVPEIHGAFLLADEHHVVTEYRKRPKKPAKETAEE